MQRLLKKLVDRMEPGPSAERRRTGRCHLLGEGWDVNGAHVVSLLETPEAYELTALTAGEIVRRVAGGGVPVGFHTPSTAFGPDLVLEFAGVTRRDL